MRASHTFTVDSENQSFDIEVSVSGQRDTYGEDRDGNRGRPCIEMGEPEYELPEMGDEERELVERDLLKQIERHHWDWE